MGKIAHTMPIKEITIEVRESGISIQGAGVGHKEDEARDLLKSALDALDKDDDKKEVFGNEIVIKNP